MIALTSHGKTLSFDIESIRKEGKQRIVTAKVGRDKFTIQQLENGNWEITHNGVHESVFSRQCTVDAVVWFMRICERANNAS